MASLWKRRAVYDAAPMGATVRRADARVDDGASLDRLLKPLPEAQELRPRLAGPLFVRAWDPAAQCDHWVESDGVRVRCFTLSGISLKHAAAVRVRWDQLRGQAPLTEELLADFVAAETDSPVTLVS